MSNFKIMSLPEVKWIWFSIQKRVQHSICNILMTYLLVPGLHRNVLCFLLGYSSFQLKALTLAAWFSLIQSIVFWFFYQLEKFLQKKKKKWSICLELNYWGEVLLSVPHAVELVKVRNEVNGDKIYPSKKVGCS